jgi:hypothetical protein
MNRFCKVLFRVSLLLLTLPLVSSNIYGCACFTYGTPRRDAKEYYSDKFDGAIFTGRVTSIKHIPAADEESLEYSELTIKVNEYWLGVSSPKIVLLTSGGPKSSCWKSWKIGKVGRQVFFISNKIDGRLYYSYCDVANWNFGSSDEDFIKYTTGVLGKPKSFQKPKGSKAEGN